MIEAIAYWLLCFCGSWLLGDGIYSWTLYHNAHSYENGRRQTFWKDHWIRLIRIIISLAMICVGWYLISKGGN